MKKRICLFVPLLALCLMLTGCGSKASASVSVSGSSSAAPSASDAPVTVAEFDEALKAAGFIDEDEYDASYLDRFADDTALYQQLTQDGINGLARPAELDAELLSSFNVKKYSSYHLEGKSMEGGKLYFLWGDSITFVVFDDDTAADSYFQSVLSSTTDYGTPPEVHTSGNVTRIEVSEDGDAYSFSLKGNTILAYSGSDSAVYGMIRSLGY